MRPANFENARVEEALEAEGDAFMPGTNHLRATQVLALLKKSSSMDLLLMVLRKPSKASH